MEKHLGEGNGQLNGHRDYVMVYTACMADTLTKMLSALLLVLLQ